MIEKINDLTGVGGVSGVQRRKSAGYYGQDETSANGDGLAVSSFAREMANISFELSQIPEVREDKVKDLKRQIDEGSYNPDLRGLAGRLIWAGINKIED
jgi:flagellar biosynthesis anti-sigma factor FlgM